MSGGMARSPLFWVIMIGWPVAAVYDVFFRPSPFFDPVILWAGLACWAILAIGLAMAYRHRPSQSGVGVEEGANDV